MELENKAHLVYLTGISLDKKRLNYINENINEDIDFKYWLYRTELNLGNGLSEFTEHLSNIVDEKGNHGKAYNWIDGVASNSINMLFTKAFGFPIPGLSIKPVLNGVFQEMGVRTLKDMENSNAYLINLFKQSEEKLKTYLPGDFFSLYLSHQSDSIGVMPLAQLASKKDYNFIPAYSDRDFYDNRYVDHIVIKIRKKIFKNNIDFKDFKNAINHTFNMHFVDIILSNLLKDVSIKDEREYKNFYDLIDKVKDEELKQIKESLSERNFFGVHILSLLFKTLQDLSGKNIFDIKVNNKKYDKNNISDQFLKELLEFSSKPEMFSFKEHDETDLEFSIYFSNGKELIEHDIDDFAYERKEELTRLKSLDTILNDPNYKELRDNCQNDEKKEIIKKIVEFEKNVLFLHLDQNFQRMSGLLNLSEIERKEQFFSLLLKQINRIDLKTDTGELDWEYINDDSDYFYVKVPIKMVLSIPIGKDNKQDQRLHIPYLIDDNKKNNIDIITVGGAEHNRALAHLINKHRQEYKDKRIFGFMDNYFDFQHKIQKTKIDKNIEYADSFLMGLNQPVSGFNAILNMRIDDGIGDSVNSDVKILAYRLNADSKIYNIVSIYGFSALASVYGTHYIVSDIYYNYNSKIHTNIFNTKYLSEMGPGLPYKKHKEYIDKGLTCILFHEDNVKDIINKKFSNKSPLYIFNVDMKKYMEVFRDELVNRIDFGYQSFSRKK